MNGKAIVNHAVKLLLLCALAGTSIDALTQANDAPVEARVLCRPTAFEGTDHKLHLAYELHLTNFYESTGPLRLLRVSVYGKSAEVPLATFSGEEIRRLLNSEQTPKAGQDVIIAPGKRIVLFMWLDLRTGEAHSRNVHHVIELEDESGKLHRLDGAWTRVESRRVLELGAPLRGLLWLVDEGPGTPKSHHWGSLLAENGIITVPQRYAIDFFGLDNTGHAVQGSVDKLDHTANGQWIGFGSEVLAVRDAVVRDLRDGVTDHAPLSPLPKPTEITARGVYGNYVVLEIAPGAFAHYAHLQNGSIQVHVGQHVKRGDVLARVGDSGNAGGPHLHFHIADKLTFELSEGVPFVFGSPTLLGKEDEAAMLDGASIFQGHLQIRKHALPLHGDVIQF